MYIHVFSTCAVTNVNRELEHGKSITYKFISKGLVNFFVSLCLCRQIKENQYPHNSIFAKPTQKFIHYITG